MILFSVSTESFVIFCFFISIQFFQTLSQNAGIGATFGEFCNLGLLSAPPGAPFSNIQSCANACFNYGWCISNGYQGMCSTFQYCSGNCVCVASCASSQSGGATPLCTYGLYPPPTVLPTQQPTMQPSGQPTSHPSRKPSVQPSSRPSSQPISKPTTQPSAQPTRFPTSQPSALPSRKPTSQPTRQPSAQPSCQPTTLPTTQPTSQPSAKPSSSPSTQPSDQPTGRPTNRPTSQPSVQPSRQPSTNPSSQPTSVPSSQPSTQPSMQPSIQPTTEPSTQPSSFPSCQPSNQPTGLPSSLPTTQPSGFPSSQPTSLPTRQPSGYPSGQPSSFPSALPSVQPSNQPTSQPSSFPTSQPSGFPSSQPTMVPTSQPTVQPTNIPSNQPSNFPSIQPSSSPTSQPSSFPSNQPTCQPSSNPTMQPTSFPSSQPSGFPSAQPSLLPSSQPTMIPSTQPSQQPSNQPTFQPSTQPSERPTSQPTLIPSVQPSNRPTRQPSSFPSSQPSTLPTVSPSTQPSCSPSLQPSSSPTSQPTVIPSTQPISSPSTQPTSTPTSGPSSQPTMIPTVQPFASPTSAPVAAIYQTNGVLHWLGTTTSISSKTENENDVLGTSYILFGRNFNHQRSFPFTISLSLLSSREFVSEVPKNDGGIRHDITTRSTTVIGDVNGDSYLDLLVGYPLASKCSVYLGNGVDELSSIVATTGESFAIIGDPFQGGGFLGWSSIRIGDLNGDGIEEIVVSAIYANAVYVIYGRKHFDKIIHIYNEMTVNNGFQIKGSDQETNFGVGLSLLHNFRKGSHADVAITAQRSTAGQCVVYILFGGSLFKNPERIIAIDQLMNNPMRCLKVVAPLYSYAGFSIAGIGDINSDGYNDLAIGSIPYDRGKYREQKTYIIYGRRFRANETELDLSEMAAEDGIIITGGGFLVAGVGDVNGDNVADVMISSYYDWKGQSSAYLISTPANVVYSPSFQPSSSPTITPSASFPLNSTLNDNSTVRNTNIPTPSYAPTQFSPTLTPTRVRFAVGISRQPVSKPSVAPSFSPTSGFHHLRGFPTASPALTPTIMPTINTTAYTVIDCSEAKEYHGKNGTHNLFRITANSGTVMIRGNDEGGAKNLYVLYGPSERVNVVIQNFRISTDMISVAHLSKVGYFYVSLSDISYSRSVPLTLLFCSENKLQAVLSSHTEFDLDESNFLFTQSNESEDNTKNTILAGVQIGIAVAVLVLLLAIFFTLSYQQKQEEKKELNHEQQWLDSLKISSEDLHIYPGFTEGDFSDQETQEIQHESLSPNLALVIKGKISQDALENKQSPNGFSSSASSSSSSSSTRSSCEVKPDQMSPSATINSIGSIKSDDWQDALAPSDNDDDDRQTQEVPPHNLVSLPVKSNVLQEFFEQSQHSSSSSSASSSSKGESQISFEMMDIEKKKFPDSSGKDKVDDINSINSDEWQHVLSASGDDDNNNEATM
jgi:hypothetical protein